MTTLEKFLTGIADSIRVKRGIGDKINAQNFSSEILNIETGTDGLPIEVATAEEMNAKLIEENIGLVFKYVGTSTEEFENGALYVIEAGE